jgi:NH3-dependent NAD+ synthetase
MQVDKRIDYIKNWISEYCKSMPKEPDSLVVGISGGIDSSVTSTLCALTGKRTISSFYAYKTNKRTARFKYRASEMA